jgi:FkbM family methyltransferase
MKLISSFLFRANRRINYYFELLRDRLEWTLSLKFTNQGVWCKNRLGQSYQPLSFPEYRYMRNGNPEVNVSLLVEGLLQEGMTVVDVGGNHGLFSMEAAHFVGSTGYVYAFEPTPELCDHIRKHLEVNHIKNVYLLEKAVGSFDGNAKLRVHHECTGLNSLASQDLVWQGSTLVADQVINVPLCKLDTVVNTENISHIDILKIDVEGFELEVLQGARNILVNQRVKYIILEIAEYHQQNSGLKIDDLLIFLDEVEYSIHLITPEGKIGEQVKDRQIYRGNGGNFVCVSSSLVK